MTQHYEFQMVPLPYAYDALEPYIDGKTMTLHHDRHLQTYINNLNNALKEYPQFHSWTLQELICNSYILPSSIRTEVINNAGGVYNHEFYFAGLLNTGDKMPVGELAEAVGKEFGSFDKMKEEMKKKGMSVFGSGYAWLVMDTRGNLRIIGTANQDSPLRFRLCPILALDVWEHAYYLKHYNLRADYIEDWFQVVNWKQANEHYLNCKNLSLS